MLRITISEAAEIFGLHKRTLMRWDAEGKFPSTRLTAHGVRYYDLKTVQEQAAWLKLRMKDRNHNRKLTAIRKAADRFSATIPLDGSPRQPHSFASMKQAYLDLRNWQTEHEKIHEEYTQFPLGFKPLVDVSDFENILEEQEILKDIREWLNDKDVALELDGDTIRYNYEIGNENTWLEVEAATSKDIEEVAREINQEFFRRTEWKS